MSGRDRTGSVGSGPRWRSLVSLALIPIVLGLTACGSSSGSAKTGQAVIIDNVSGSLWTCGFNPYSASQGAGQMFSAGVFYEPLWYVNAINDRSQPWLATSYAWSGGNKTLTFTLRKGVNWSDGKPLTPADVVFTFQLLKRFSGLDLNAVWTVLSGVSAKGNTVVFTFKSPAVPYFYYIGDQTFIVPQHLWSSIKNPVTFVDKSPVGTGPFLLKSCSPQDIIYKRNPHYWQKGKPYVSEVRYPAFMDNQPGNQYLAQGKANWGGQYIPNVKTYYLNRDSAHRHIWYPPASADVDLFPNLTTWPTNILAVRQAISYGINRNNVSRLGVYGYLPPANQAGIIIPNFKSWYDTALASQYPYSYNPGKAMSLLQGAGFKRGSDGIFRDKSGRKLSLAIINNGGYTDWVAENKIIIQNLRAIGIDATAQNLSGNDWVARLQQGHYQLGYNDVTGGPTPYYQYYQLLHSANTAPIGQTAASNYERFRSSSVDQLLNSYAATTSSSQQHTIINTIQKTMLTQLPVIPVLENVNWYQYDTSAITGWPTPSNPYANPSPYNFPDWAQLLMNVRPK